MLGVRGDDWYFSYVVDGILPRIPLPAKPERTEGLWHHTCFEAFVALKGGGYLEFNFSPSRQWAAFRFDGYRAGQSDFAIAAPVIEPIEDGIRAAVKMTAITRDRYNTALSAVIEETDGTKSYWALAHPPGKPDFHHPTCFAATLPAPQKP